MIFQNPGVIPDPVLRNPCVILSPILRNPGVILSPILRNPGVILSLWRRIFLFQEFFQRLHQILQVHHAGRLINRVHGQLGQADIHRIHGHMGV